MNYVNFLIICKLIQKKQIREAAIHRCFSEQMFLKILQYLQENTCVGISIGNIAKFLRTNFFIEHLGWLLLKSLTDLCITEGHWCLK